MRTAAFLLPILMCAGLLCACEKLDLTEDGESSNGGGTPSPSLSALTISEALSQSEVEKDVAVTGYIVGYIQGTSLSNAQFDCPTDEANTNMLLADDINETDVANLLPVRLTTTGEDFRLQLNLYDHPEYLYQPITIEGYLDSYFTVNGITKIYSYTFGTSGNTSYTPQTDHSEAVLEGR